MGNPPVASPAQIYREHGRSATVRTRSSSASSQRSIAAIAACANSPAIPAAVLPERTRIGHNIGLQEPIPIPIVSMGARQSTPHGRGRGGVELRNAWRSKNNKIMPKLPHRPRARRRAGPRPRCRRGGTPGRRRPRSAGSPWVPAARRRGGPRGGRGGGWPNRARRAGGSCSRPGRHRRCSGCRPSR